MLITRTRLLTLLVEVLAALGLVAAAILYAEFGPIAWMPSVRWWTLATLTVALGWLAASEYRAHRRRLSFWLTLAGLLAIHVSAWSVVIVRTESFGLLWFVVAAPFEGVGVAWTLERAGFGPGHRRQRRAARVRRGR